LVNNNPQGFVRADEVWPRLQEWLGWLRTLGGWPPANLALLAALLALVAHDVWRRRLTRAAWLDLSLTVFILVYLAAYWLVAFSVYDRYLLPLVPLLGLLLARALVLPFSRRTAWAVLALVGLMAWPAWRAARSGYPVGGDHGAYDGIDELAAYLDGLPPATVIYDHWLGWPLDFYLFDSPAYTTYFATPADLTTALLEDSGEQPAVLLLPAWVGHDDVLAAVTEGGCQAQPAFQTVNRYGEPTLLVMTLGKEPASLK
jgi:hypothetical protein